MYAKEAKDIAINYYDKFSTDNLVSFFDWVKEMSEEGKFEGFYVFPEATSGDEFTYLALIGYDLDWRGDNFFVSWHGLTN